MPFARRHIAVLNRSTVATDDEVHAIVEALQEQVHRDFRPHWGIDALLKFVPKDDLRSWKGAWNLVVLDTSDEANALGYHDLTPEGLPLGKCFAKTDLTYGAKLSITMSHELLEMLGDPNIQMCAQADDGTIYAYENCDAVEADDLGYDIGGVTVSDFVTPEWFMSGPPADAKMSFCGHVSKPFELAPGGYISVFRNGKWSQLYAKAQVESHGRILAIPGDEPGALPTVAAPPITRPPVGSRRERRTIGPAGWVRSLD